MKDAERIAYDYLHTDPSHRDPDTPIIKTKQAHEPIHFTGFFGPWDRNYWTVNKRFSIQTKTIFVHLFLSQNHHMKRQNLYYMLIIVQKFMLNLYEINR
jgi:hypothetical protein